MHTPELWWIYGKPHFFGLTDNTKINITRENPAIRDEPLYMTTWQAGASKYIRNNKIGRKAACLSFPHTHTQNGEKSANCTSLVKISKTKLKLFWGLYWPRPVICSLFPVPRCLIALQTKKEYVSGLISAAVERISISRMQDFCCM